MTTNNDYTHRLKTYHFLKSVSKSKKLYNYLCCKGALKAPWSNPHSKKYWLWHLCHCQKKAWEKTEKLCKMNQSTVFYPNYTRVREELKKFCHSASWQCIGRKGVMGSSQSPNGHNPFFGTFFIMKLVQDNWPFSWQNRLAERQLSTN